MRFTSLIVELIRARPVLVFWLVALAQAALWFMLPALLYSSPPGEVALNLAYGREYLLGSIQGPPLSFWLADIAFRAAGNSVFGVYLLAQICFVVSFWAIFRLGRAIVGAQHAVAGGAADHHHHRLLVPVGRVRPAHAGAAAMGAVAAERLAHHRRGPAQRLVCAVDLMPGLLLLTTHAAPLLLAMLVMFALATARGRRMLTSFDPFFALIVVAVLVVPYAMFVLRNGIGWQLPLTNVSALEEGLWRWLEIIGGLALALAGVVLLVIFNSRKLSGARGARAGDLPPACRSARTQFCLLLCDRAAAVVQRGSPRCSTCRRWSPAPAPSCC